MNIPLKIIWVLAVLLNVAGLITNLYTNNPVWVIINAGCLGYLVSVKETFFE